MNQEFTIFIVEDDEILNRLIQINLSREGYSVKGLQTGNEALKYLSEKENILLLLDYYLCDMCAADVIKKLKEHEFTIPFIIMTGNGDEKIAVEMMKLGACDYLVKDKNFLELLPSVVNKSIEKLKMERKLFETENSLVNSEEKFKYIFNSISDSIIIHNIDDGNIIDFNDSLITLLGYERESLSGFNVKNLVIPQYTYRNSLKEIKEKNHIYFEATFIRSDKTEIPVEINARLINYYGKEVILSIIRDIREKKHAEKEKIKLEEQLRQVQKMEAIGILAGGVAHDFNNLLNVIQGRIELILMDMAEEHPFYKELDIILKTSSRASNLTRQLLLFARKQPINIIPLDINKLILNLNKMLTRLIGENFSLHTDLNLDLWSINGDSGTIEQAIMNLVVNARDAMPNGGKIIIKTENLCIKEDVHKKRKAGKYICISVIDEGTGIEEYNMSRIFEPFFTTKGIGGGTGLGLAVVYGIVEQHGGWIEAANNNTRGATFTLYIPAIPDNPQEEKHDSKSLKTLSGHGENILIIEDDESLKQIASILLLKNGYKVSTARSCKEAIEVASDINLKIHLVFTDMILPDGRGTEIFQKIKEIHPNIKVIFTSGYTDRQDDWEHFREKGYTYIQKPYTIKDLLKAIEREFNT